MFYIGPLLICDVTQGGGCAREERGDDYHIKIRTITMIKNGAMTQQSCEHRDPHDVFFPSGLFVKQQQTQCQTPHTHLRADQPVRHPIILREVLSHRGAAVPTESSGGRPTPTRHRAGVASMARRA